jgi:hypothetical protein
MTFHSSPESSAFAGPARRAPEMALSRPITRRGVSLAATTPETAAGEPLVLVLPLPDNRGNDRKHWRTAHRDKVAYWDACALMKNPRSPAAPLTRVRVAYHFTHGGAAMDWDNLAARVKHLQDWLVVAGYIADDSPKVIKGTPPLTDTPHRPKSEHCVVVTLTPMGEGA